MPHIPDLHADHDPLAIAAYAAGDAEGAELDAASALVATCHECAALHHDLRAISLALPSVPPPVRTRDFRLTPEQAASIRPSGWRRLLAPFAGPRFAFAGPLGTGLATLGLAGLLVGGSLGAPIAQAPAGGGAGSAASGAAAASGPVDERASSMAATGPQEASPAAMPAPTAALKADEPAASMAPMEPQTNMNLSPLASGEVTELQYATMGSEAPVDGVSGAAAGAGEEPAGGRMTDAVGDAGTSTGLPVVLVGSALALVLGLGLLALRLVGRRTGGAI